MTIEWNKVTWYSKLIALVLFITLPIIGFYLGVQYGKTTADLQNYKLPQIQNVTPNTKNNIASSSVDTSNVSTTLNADGWKTYRNEKYGFEFSYPNDFQPEEKARQDRILLNRQVGETSTDLIVDVIESKEKTLEAWLNQDLFGGSPSIEELLNKSLATKISIDNLKGYLIPDYTSDTGSGALVVLQNNEGNLILNFGIEDSGSGRKGRNLKSVTKEVESVVKTLKFIK